MIPPKPSVQKLEPYLSPDECRANFLRLDFNENTQGASPRVLEALRNITLEECARYPEYEDFRRALASFAKVREDEVIATNGSDEAIRALFDTYVACGDEVILLTPSYSLYQNFAQIAGAQINWVNYEPDFSFPIERVLELITPSTRLIALANPNNPTGTLIARDDIVKIAAANPKMVVLLDEAYTQFARTTNIDLIGAFENIFVTQTFSKAYGLAGLRIGYLLSCEANIQNISKVISPAYSVNRLAMLAAKATIDDARFFEEQIEATIVIRKAFVVGLQELGFAAIESAANFVLVNFSEQAEAIYLALLQNQILVRPRPEQSLKGYLRITIGTQAQMQRLLSLLQPFSPQRRTQ